MPVSPETDLPEVKPMVPSLGTRNALDLRSVAAVNSFVAFVRGPQGDAVAQRTKEIFDARLAAGETYVEDPHADMWEARRQLEALVTGQFGTLPPPGANHPTPELQAAIGFAQANGAMVASIEEDADGNFTAREADDFLHLTASDESLADYSPRDPTPPRQTSSLDSIILDQSEL